MKKNMKSFHPSKINFKAGELVRLIEEFELWPHTIGVVLSDHPMEQKGSSPNDALVHVLFADGKDIWTPRVFLERFGNE